jgi:hypothetical protein
MTQVEAEKLAQRSAITHDEPKLSKKERIALKQQRLLAKAQRIAQRVITTKSHRLYGYKNSKLLDTNT